MFRRKRNRYPWILMRGVGELVCERCGLSYQPNLPAPINVYLAIVKAFAEDHRKCEAKSP